MKLLPIRCYYCNKFISHYSYTEPDYDKEELQICCRSLILSHYS